ncbi:MAG: hypothetical protein ABJA61_00580 [Caldimonas sp.]
MSAASPAIALPIVLLEERPPTEVEPPSKTAPPVVRATQVNRCADTAGRVVHQDSPCFPAPAPVTAATQAPDVVELSAMEPRPRADAPRVREAETMGGWEKWLRYSSWKLVLLGLVGYGVVRGTRAVRTSYAFKQAAAEAEDSRSSRGRSSLARKY